MLPGDAVIRSLDPLDPHESALAEANARAREDARSRLVASIEGFDLARIVQTTRGSRPSFGRLTDEGRRRTHLVGPLDEFLANHDVYARDADVSSARLVQARDGIDRTSVAVGDLVLPPPTATSPQRADAAGIVRALIDGLSVKVKTLDESFPGLSAFVEDVERVVGRRSGILAFLSGPGALGWGAHFAYHDLLVVQVAGTKAWTTYEPIEPNALSPHTPYRVSEAQDWEGVLRPGDVMHLPRGWGHQVVGTDEFSVHMTLSLGARPAAQILLAAAAASASFPALRADLAAGTIPDPLLLGAAMEGDWTDRVVAGWRARMPARPHHVLSTTARAVSALQSGSPLGDDLLVRLSAPGGVHVVADGSTAEPTLAVAGRAVHLALADEAAFALLAAGRPCTFAEVADRCPDPVGLLEVLLVSGVVHVEAPARSDHPAADFVAGRQTSPSRPPPIVVAPARETTAAIRPLRGSDPLEAALRAGIAAGRAAARTSLDAMFQGPAIHDALSGASAVAVGRVTGDLGGDAALDQLIAQHDLSGPKVTLVTPAPPVADHLFQPAFSWYSPFLLDPRRVIQVLEGEGFLTLHAVDESLPVPGAWAEVIERATGWRCSIDAHLSRSGATFGPVDHPSLVIGVSGSAAWRVDTTDHRPDGAASTGTLQPGGVVYLPRRHRATFAPTDQLTIRFSVALHSPGEQGLVASAEPQSTGRPAQRFLRENWFGGNQNSRKDGLAPVLEGPGRDPELALDRPPRPEELSALLALRAETEVVSAWGATTPARTHRRFSTVAAVLTGDDEPAATVRLAAPGGAAVAETPPDTPTNTPDGAPSASPGAVDLVIAGHRLAVAADLVPMLARLLEGSPVLVADLQRHADPARLAAGLLTLVGLGLVEVGT